MRQALILALLRIIGRQRLINRGKIGLLHRLASPEKLASQRFTTDFFGLRYSGDVSNWIDWNVYFAGVYESEFVELLTHGRRVKPRRESAPPDRIPPRAASA